jgi:hypothetical protein
VAKRFLALVLFALLLTVSCRPLAPRYWLDALNLQLDAETCSYAGRDCQTHWLICAGQCEKPNRAIELHEVCRNYRKGHRYPCADVRGETFEAAICADWEEGWCDWEVSCMPRPVSCGGKAEIARKQGEAQSE